MRRFETGPPTQRPLRLKAAILSRTRSPITSRSNCAKDKSTLRVRRPMLEVVLKDWVTETNETSCAFEKLDELGEVGKRPRQPIDLVDDDDVDLLRSDLVQQGLEGGPIERRTGEGAIIEAVGNEPPALVGLALDIGLAGFALGVEGVEGKIEIMLGRFARIDGAMLRLWGDRFHTASLGWLAGGWALIDPDRGAGLVSAAAGAVSPAPPAYASEKRGFAARRLTPSNALVREEVQSDSTPYAP